MGMYQIERLVHRLQLAGDAYLSIDVPQSQLCLLSPVRVPICRFAYLYATS